MHKAALLSFLPFLLFAIVRLNTRADNVEFDFDVTHGTFYSMLQMYSKLAYFIAIAGGLVAYRIGERGHFAAMEFLLSAFCAVLFLAWMTFQYEMYLHARYPRDGSAGASSYTPNAYASTVALGASAVLLFAGGILSLGASYIGGLQ